MNAPLENGYHWAFTEMLVPTILYVAERNGKVLCEMIGVEAVFTQEQVEKLFVCIDQKVILPPSFDAVRPPRNRFERLIVKVLKRH